MPSFGGIGRPEAVGELVFLRFVVRVATVVAAALLVEDRDDHLDEGAVGHIINGPGRHGQRHAWLI